MRSVLILLVLCPATAVAQGWSSGTNDDGVWFQAGAESPPGAEVFRDMALTCGGRSPQNRPIEESENNHPITTDPGTLDLILRPESSLSADYLEVPTPLPGQVWVDGRAFDLPRMEADYFQNGYAANLPADGSLVTALMGGSRATFALEGTEMREVRLAGSRRAITEIAQFCAGMSAQAADMGGGVSRGMGAVDLEAALAVSAAFCKEGGNAFELGDEAVTEAEFNGDGLTDYVIDFRHARCGDSMGTLYCRSSGCDYEVHVSGLGNADHYPLQGGTAYELRLERAADGRQDLVTVERMGGPNDIFVRRWRVDGETFEEVSRVSAQ